MHYQNLERQRPTGRTARTPGPEGTSNRAACLQVTEADSWFNRAISDGRSVLSPLKDEFYGRKGKVRDPLGRLEIYRG